MIAPDDNSGLFLRQDCHASQGSEKAASRIDMSSLAKMREGNGRVVDRLQPPWIAVEARRRTVDANHRFAEQSALPGTIKQC
jgi:hypothetical protein